MITPTLVAVAIYSFGAGASAAVLLLGAWVTVEEASNDEARRQELASIVFLVPLGIVLWPLLIAFWAVASLGRR